MRFKNHQQPIVIPQRAITQIVNNNFHLAPIHESRVDPEINNVQSDDNVPKKKRIKLRKSSSLEIKNKKGYEVGRESKISENPFHDFLKKKQKLAHKQQKVDEIMQEKKIIVTSDQPKLQNRNVNQFNQMKLSTPSNKKSSRKQDKHK